MSRFSTSPGIVSFCAVLTTAIAITTPATGASLPPNGPIYATYQGETIDLATGWSGAHACVAKGAAEVVCYSTSAEALAAIATFGSTNTDGAANAHPDTSCNSGYVVLYAGSYYKGNDLFLENYGYWVNLDSYGFGDTVNSWANTTGCTAAGAKTTNGTGSQITLGASNDQATMPSGWSNAMNSSEIS